MKILKIVELIKPASPQLLKSPTTQFNQLTASKIAEINCMHTCILFIYWFCFMWLHYRIFKNKKALKKVYDVLQIGSFSLHLKLHTQAATEYSHVHPHKFFRDHCNLFYYQQHIREIPTVELLPTSAFNVATFKTPQNMQQKCKEDLCTSAS